MSSIGVVLPTMSTRDRAPGDVVAAARHAEDLGFESVWVVDQLVAGTGVPVLDSLTSLAAAAGATSRIRLGVGVLVLPLRSVVWVAKQVASLQHISGDRLLLGVGVGGDRHDRSWAAAGVNPRERGRLVDEALRVLPPLIAGSPVDLGSGPVQLSPAATVPPIIVGGMSDAAVRRAAAFDGWFPIGGPDDIPALRQRVAKPLTTTVVVAVDGDPALPSRASIIRSLTDPDGMFGFPAAFAEEALVHGGPAEVGKQLAAFEADRVVVTIAAGDWFRQAELLAEAVSAAG
jgi:alkanesulfonate monooxygenase SsuD/methylene tetrahydromethanopterin reductase-like flavin-dependent oxidoreductase (luciferase family)